MNAFIITPLDPAGSLISDYISRALSEAGIVSRRANATFGGPITESVLESIRKADVIFCDISRQNSHVFYELGFAQANRKDVILLRSTDADADLPFDLHGFLYLVYDAKNLKSLQQQIRSVANRLLLRQGGTNG